ncbi:hypothetical protein SLS58_009958 [Diplodia intermedia]|uniref:Uncharacterized protein n=1 Tax=Diplodia intermedia TaxID=856260 RepID=A0ABR3T984_9PEZI
MSGTAAITFLLTVIALYFIVDLFEAFKRSKETLTKKLERGIRAWVTKETPRHLYQMETFKIHQQGGLHPFRVILKVKEELLVVHQGERIAPAS